MQRASPFTPNVLARSGSHDASDQPECQLIGCRERCGRIHQQLVTAPQRWMIYCPRGWAMVTNWPDPGTHYVCRTDFERTQVFLRMANAEAAAAAAVQRAMDEGRDA